MHRILSIPAQNGIFPLQDSAAKERRNAELCRIVTFLHRMSSLLCRIHDWGALGCMEYGTFLGRAMGEKPMKINRTRRPGYSFHVEPANLTATRGKSQQGISTYQLLRVRKVECLSHLQCLADFYPALASARLPEWLQTSAKRQSFAPGVQTQRPDTCTRKNSGEIGGCTGSSFSCYPLKK